MVFDLPEWLRADAGLPSLNLEDWSLEAGWIKPSSFTKDWKGFQSEKSICWKHLLWWLRAGVSAPRTTSSAESLSQPPSTPSRPHPRCSICKSTLSSKHLLITFSTTSFSVLLNCLSQPTGECQRTWIRAISGSDCAWALCAALITLDIFPRFSLDFNITLVPLLYLQLPLTCRWKIVAQHFISASTSWLSIRDQLTAELQSTYWAVSNRSSGSVRLTSITILYGLYIKLEEKQNKASLVFLQMSPGNGRQKHVEMIQCALWGLIHLKITTRVVNHAEHKEIYNLNL